MLPISKKLIPGEVQIKSGVMSLRRARFSSQPPVPCVPSAEICYVPCLCPNQVQTDLGQGSGGGTGATCCSSAALQSYFRLRRSLTVAFKDTPSVLVVEICTDPPKTAPPVGTAHGCAARPGLSASAPARDHQAAAGIAPGVVVTNVDGQCHLPRPSQPPAPLPPRDAPRTTRGPTGPGLGSGRWRDPELWPLPGADVRASPAALRSQILLPSQAKHRVSVAWLRA